MAVSPDAKTVAIAARGRPKQIQMADGRMRSDGSRADSTISRVDSESGQERREIVIAESYVNSLAFSPDGQLLAAGTWFHWERSVIHIYSAERQEGGPDDRDPLSTHIGVGLHAGREATGGRDVRHVDFDLGSTLRSQMRFWLPGQQIAEIKCKKSLKNGFYSELTETFQYQPSAESNSS
jgi:WD40 repeat protein